MFVEISFVGEFGKSSTLLTKKTATGQGDFGHLDSHVRIRLIASILPTLYIDEITWQGRISRRPVRDLWSATVTIMPHVFYDDNGQDGHVGLK